MTREEVKNLMRIISVSFNHSGFQGKSAAELTPIINAWAMMLADIDYQDAQKAVVMHACSNKFAPAISEIRELVQSLHNPSGALTPDEVWNMALTAVRKFGRLNTEKALATLPEQTRAFVKRWYLDICNSENLDVVRGQFQKAWSLQEQRETKMRLYPDSVRELIGSMTERMLLHD